MRLRHAAASSCIALAIAACDSTSPASAPGSLSFNFSGTAVGSGTFSAVGNLSPFDTAMTLPFTIGLLDDTSLGLSLWAYLPGVSQARWGFIRASGRTPGVFPIDSTCQILNCSAIGVEFGGDPFGDAGADFSCVITVGTVTLSTVNSKRTSGTFSGTGTCISRAGTISAFTVSNGAFDAPFVRLS